MSQTEERLIRFHFVWTIALTQVRVDVESLTELAWLD